MTAVSSIACTGENALVGVALSARSEPAPPQSPMGLCFSAAAELNGSDVRKKLQRRTSPCGGADSLRAERPSAVFDFASGLTRESRPRTRRNTRGC
jgi:hypothetical protein